jgi:Mrp family chromosome partitioning ATPase/capsular polysaccharide biosynthesis protein
MGGDDIRDFVAPVWRRRWLLLAIITISTVAAYTSSSRRPAVYRSTTQVFVSNTQIESIIGGGGAVGDDRQTQDQARLLLSRPVGDAVRRRMNLAESNGALLTSVTASPETGSNFVTVTAERPTAEEAATLANTFVQEYIRFRRDQLARDAEAAVRRLRAEFAALPRTQATSQQREDLLDTIRQLRALQAVAPSNIRQTNRAEVASLPIAPRPKRDALFGFAISALLGLALVFTLERFDRRIKLSEDVSGIYGAPLLANVPHVADPSEVDDGTALVPDALVEPFRSLRTNIQLASLDHPLDRIIVSSAVAGEGKSTIVRNLALTYHEWGLSVVVVEADLRRPSLPSLFGIAAPEIGLTSVLTGEADLDEALIELEPQSAGAEYLERVRSRNVGANIADFEVSTPRLALLPAGPVAPNPQAVLAAARTHALLDDLGRRFDIVLIDTPPLLVVSDAISLLPHAAAVLLVARVGTTERSAAARVMTVCTVDPAVRVIGIVANDLEAGAGPSYGYGYGYNSR